MSRKHDASIKNLETQIGQLSRQIVALPSSSGGFTGNTVDNPKNETCKVVETYFGVVTEKGEVERAQDDEIEKKECGSEKEDGENQGDKEERGVIIDQLIDKNSPWKRTKKKILNLPDYIKPPYPIIQKKLVHEDGTIMFEKFKEVLTQLRALLKGGKQKLNQDQVNMTEKEEIAKPSEVPLKMKDPGEFSITCTIGGLKIPHALCDLGLSINVMSLSKFKELKIREIIQSNMRLTLADSSVTHPLGIV
ncbi:uncharacterized protein LOC127123897 [Lathyrus oleraceus]|uniref:uncharacterized protein LOC127123897 n=1 Tax=Pisum sativum TaxID=3888 RepID=UPI0021D1EE0F|nr:uncharacterized protein LOC127123897 [Pisum sativum]